MAALDHTPSHPHPTLSNTPVEQEPKRRRYRIPRSCDRCRASKIKCVFQDGQCVACTHARAKCTFANPGSLQERPPTHKDAEHLQARIRSLERLIQAIDPTIDLTNLSEFNKTGKLIPSKLDQLRPPASSATSSTTQKPTQLPTEPPDPKIDPTLSPFFLRSQFKLNTSAVNLPFSVADVNALSPVDKIIRQEYSRNLYWHINLYPEPDLEQSLIQLYFRNVHPCLPLLHPTTFMQDLYSGLPRTSDSFRALCFSMMAIASRFSKDPRVFLDLEGQVQPSVQVAGLRYAIAAASYLLQPILVPSNIHDLQASLLIVVSALGDLSLDDSWDLVGIGIQRARDTGAHLENSPQWKTSPLQDHLRRKAFTMLYEFDCLLSAAIGKPPYMQESDFDVLPCDLDFDIAIETFTNPFDVSPTTNSALQEEIKVTNDICLAYCTLKSSFGGINNSFPLMHAMNCRRDPNPDIKYLNCIKLLVNQLDSSMSKCYEKIAQKFSAHQSSNATVTDCQLLASVNATTWYHESRLLTHKALMGVKEEKKNSRQETGATSSSTAEGTSKTMVKNPHAEICIESARMILSLIDRLYQRNLLDLGYYWIPLRITNALIVLIVSMPNFKNALPTDQRNIRLYEISLGIQILKALAPSTFIAEKCSKMMIQLQECVLRKDLIQNSKKPGLPSSSLSPSKVH